MSNLVPNPENKILTMGDLSYVATGYDAFNSKVPSATRSNAPAMKSAFNSYSYTDIGYLGTTADFTISFEEEQVSVAGNCGVGEFSRTVEKTPTFNFTRYDVGNLEAWAYIHGYTVENVLGSLVSGATQAVVNPSAYLKFIQIENQNGDGSAITVNSVTGSTDGLLVAGTDYEVVQNGEGDYGIQLISGGAITTLTQTFTIDYDYTPNVSKLTAGNIEGEQVPYGMYKFVSCVNPISPTEGVRYTIYMDKFFASTPAAMTFIKTPEETFEAISVAFTAAKGGKWLIDKETVSL